MEARHGHGTLSPQNKRKLRHYHVVVMRSQLVRGSEILRRKMANVVFGREFD